MEYFMQIIKPKIHCLIASGLILFSSLAFSQYPNKTIKFVVPFPAGQATDIFSRIVADELSQTLPQKVMVDNKGGANGIPGTLFGKEATPDGYTLTMASSSTIAVNPALYPGLPYSPKDFEPVNGVFIVPLLLVANQNSPFTTLKQIVDYAQSNPGKLEWAYSAPNQQLAEELLKTRAKIDILSVPYKGSGQAVTDLIGGQINLAVETLPTIAPHITSGKVRPIAVMTAKRIPQLPNVPTVAELGYPGFEGPGWGGILAPKGTPKEVVEKLSKDIRARLANPEVQKKINDRGAIVDSRDAKQWGDFVNAEVAKWAEIVKIAGIQGQ
jgi:tripartite-type tricarboxylate transporter receptor subunit TctC